MKHEDTADRMQERDVARRYRLTVGDGFRLAVGFWLFSLVVTFFVLLAWLGLLLIGVAT